MTAITDGLQRNARAYACRPAADYEKQAAIGEGTFGVVYKAIENATGRTVAIKKLRDMKSSRSSAAGIDLATLREIMLLQEMRHENVIDLVEVYCYNSSISLVFEFCTTDLEVVIKDSKQILDAQIIKAHMLGSLRGLAHCHANWILHRNAAARSLQHCITTPHPQAAVPLQSGPNPTQHGP